MSNVCPKPRCGGMLVLDYEAGDEWVCVRCSVRLYATKPDTGEKKANPLFCPECGKRTWGEWSSRAIVCDDCVYVKRTLAYLGMVDGGL